jgi:cytolysin (calcineurin-like family phosphatase)
MNTYWVVKADVIVSASDEKPKVAKEEYLVDAMSATEAEAKVAKDFEGSGVQHEVTSAIKSRIIKVIE